MKTEAEQVQEALKELGAVVEAKHAKLTRQVNELEAQANRRQLGLGGLETSKAVDPAEQKALERYLRAGDASELKAMGLGSDPSGGYAVTPQVSADIARVALDYSPLRQLAASVAVSRADYKRLISTSAMGAEWRGETATRSETTTPAFATISPPSGEVSSVVPITRWLLEDAEYDLAKFIAEETGKAHGVSEGAAFAAGNGINKPAGLLSAPRTAQADGVRAFGTLQEVLSGTSGDVRGASGSQADGLVDALFALKPAYRAKASWLMHPSCVAQARKLKDTNGNLLWSPALAAGTPSTLLGCPVFEDPNLEAPSAGSFSVIVGDFSAGYLIIDIGRPVLIRDEVTQKGKVLFEVARRVGGAVIDSNALKVMKLAAA
jgi:HK97 family phage major capsid protein